MPTKMPARFTNADAARQHLESLLWPDGPVCAHCGVIGEATALKGQSTRPGVYWCNACQKPFSVTVGSVYESSKVPLNTWLYANHLLCSSKKGISGHQLARMLGVTYKTAWFMAHRIRAAMAPAAGSEPPLGGEGKIVEADEAYIGKKDGKRKHKGAGGYGHKRTVLSLVERGGKIRSFKVGSSKREDIGPVIRANVHPDSALHTDGSKLYHGLGATKGHAAVDHNKEYVRQGTTSVVHTNTLEGFFSVFKRGMIGTYQHCSEAHLHRYLAEFDFRYSNRASLEIDDVQRTKTALAGIVGKRLTYRRTNEARHG